MDNDNQMDDPQDNIPSITTEETSSLGSIRINHSVVASIVRIAALENDGVFSIPGGFVDGIAEIFSKKESDKGIRVTESEQELYQIEIRLILKYGVELAACAYEVQDAIKNRVESMTGKMVERVDVVIDGVKPKEEANKHHSDNPLRNDG